MKKFCLLSLVLQIAVITPLRAATPAEQVGEAIESLANAPNYGWSSVWPKRNISLGWPGLPKREGDSVFGWLTNDISFPKMGACLLKLDGMISNDGTMVVDLEFASTGVGISGGSIEFPLFPEEAFRLVSPPGKPRAMTRLKSRLAPKDDRTIHLPNPGGEIPANGNWFLIETNSQSHPQLAAAIQSICVPADQAQELLRACGEVEEDGEGSYVGRLRPESLKSGAGWLKSFENELDHASVRFRLSNGQLSGFEFIGQRHGSDKYPRRALTVRQIVEIKNVGTSQVAIPNKAAALLGN